MKLHHARLTASIQAEPGRIGGNGKALQAAEYELVLISNLRCIKVSKPNWAAPVFIPVEKFDCFSPDPEGIVRKP